KEQAYNMGITLDRATIKKQAQLIVRKLATPDDFKAQLVQQAQSTYPAYTDQLQAGQTMMDIASPYIQQMAQDLQIPETSINLTDPLVKRALNGVNSNGKPTGMDTVSFQNLVRNDPRWGQSTETQGKAMDVGRQVLQNLGLI